MFGSVWKHYEACTIKLEFGCGKKDIKKQMTRITYLERTCVRVCCSTRWALNMRGSCVSDEWCRMMYGGFLHFSRKMYERHLLSSYEKHHFLIIAKETLSSRIMYGQVLNYFQTPRFTHPRSRWLLVCEYCRSVKAMEDDRLRWGRHPYKLSTKDNRWASVSYFW